MNWCLVVLALLLLVTVQQSNAIFGIGDKKKREEAEAKQKAEDSLLAGLQGEFGRTDAEFSSFASRSGINRLYWC
jgi:hypothetical protein